MKNPDDDLWGELRAKHPYKLVQAIKARLERGEPFLISPDQLAAEAHAQPIRAQRLLGDLQALGLLEERQRWVCPCERQEELIADQAEGSVCPFCEEAFK